MGRPRITWALAAGILVGCAEPLPQAGPTEREGTRPVFCYRTLADIDCYVEVDPGRETRLVGMYMYVGEPWWITYGVAAGDAGEEAADGPLPLFPVSP
jgi:hypothetical protein